MYIYIYISPLFQCVTILRYDCFINILQSRTTPVWMKLALDVEDSA